MTLAPTVDAECFLFTIVVVCVIEVISICCLYKRVQAACCYLVHLIRPCDDEVYYKWLFCYSGKCNYWFYVNPCSDAVMEESSNWLPCSHLNAYFSKDNDKLVFTVFVRPVSLYLFGYCIDRLVEINNRYLALIQDQNSPSSCPSRLTVAIECAWSRRRANSVSTNHV